MSRNRIAGELRDAEVLQWTAAGPAQEGTQKHDLA